MKFMAWLPFARRPAAMITNQGMPRVGRNRPSAIISSSGDSLLCGDRSHNQKGLIGIRREQCVRILLVREALESHRIVLAPLWAGEQRHGGRVLGVELLQLHGDRVLLLHNR